MNSCVYLFVCLQFLDNILKLNHNIGKYSNPITLLELHIYLYLQILRASQCIVI